MDTAAVDVIRLILEYLNGYELRAFALTSTRNLKIIWRYMRFFTIPSYFKGDPHEIVSWRREVLTEYQKERAIRIRFQRANFRYMIHVLSAFRCEFCMVKVRYKIRVDTSCTFCRWRPPTEFIYTEKLRLIYEPEEEIDVTKINPSKIIPYDPNDHLNLPTASYVFYEFRD